MAPTVDERMVFLEARMDEVGRAIIDLKGSIAALDQRFTALDQKLDTRIDALDRKLDARIDAVDRKLDASNDTSNRRFDLVDVKFQTVYRIQFTTLFAIVAGLVAVITRLI